MSLISNIFSKKKETVPYSKYMEMRRFLASEIKKRNEIIDKLREENAVLFRSSLKASKDQMKIDPGLQEKKNRA